MFRNRTIQVDLVKKAKDPQSPESDQKDANLDDVVDVVTHAVEKIVVKIGFVVVAYVLLDTFRKVSIEHAKSE